MMSIAITIQIYDDMGNLSFNAEYGMMSIAILCLGSLAGTDIKTRFWSTSAKNPSIAEIFAWTLF